MNSMIDRFRRSLAMRGALGTARMCAGCVMAQLSPAWRRAEESRRQIDAAFDAKYNVHTSGDFWPTRESVVGQNWSYGVSYEAIDPGEFLTIIHQLAIPQSEFTFIDFGCGKGRAVLLASTFPFRKVIGVEYCLDLTRVAEENVRRFPESARRCPHIEIVCADAAEFPLPDGPLLLFFYNPFWRPVMEKVVANAAASFAGNPRHFLVLYFTPRFADLWENAGFLKRVQTAPAIFDTGPIAARLPEQFSLAG